MAFTSVAFALFFVLTSVAWYLVAARWRWVVALVASYAFCAVASTASAVLLATVTLLGWAVGILLPRCRTTMLRGMILVTGVGMLVVALFLPRLLISRDGATAIQDIVFRGVGAVGLMGVSFFTLKVIAYVADVYTGRAAPERHLGIFAAYVGLFVELPAGPIDRAQNLIPQLRDPAGFDEGRAAHGLRLILWGLFEKLVVADRLAPLVASVYHDPYGRPGIALIVATVLFAFQLLADFSGYTDIARGLGAVLGLRLAPNFDMPYRARSVSEFWRRWHISFSSWLRDYVFLPLNYTFARWLEGKRLLGFNDEYWAYALASFATMILGGVWHGSSGTFVLWGGSIALFMVVSVFTRKVQVRLKIRIGLRKWPRLHAATQVGATFGLVCAAWVFFRSKDVADSLHILSHLGSGWNPVDVLAYCLSSMSRLFGAGTPSGLNPGGSPLGFGLKDLLAAFSITTLFCAAEVLRSQAKVGSWFRRQPFWRRWVLYYAILVAIVVLMAPDRQGFLYEKF